MFDKLAVPFYSHVVEWKPQALSADKKRALAAAYVDMREYEDRLDEVFPQWTSSVQFLVTDKKVAAIVSLTIDGITRVNVGEASLEDENAFTSAYAQGFKRACSDFGLGRYLYRLPQVWCDYDEKRRAIIGAPELPDWARHPDERTKPAAQPAQPAQPTAQSAVQPANPAPAPAPSTAPAGAVPTAEADAKDPGNTVIHFGRYNGQTLKEVWSSGPAGKGWIRWMAGDGFAPKSEKDLALKEKANLFLGLVALNVA